MIEINLLPVELRGRKRKEGSIDALSLPVLPIAAGVAVLAISLWLIVALFAGKKDVATEKLNSEWESIRPGKQEYDKITSETSELSKAIEFIKKISQPDINWTQLLGALDQSVTPGVWLSRLNLESQGKVFNYRNPEDKPTRLILAGYVLGTSEAATSGVARFITSLKGTESFASYFTEIELVEMKLETIGGEDTMFFRLKCEFEKKEEPPVKTEGRRKRKTSK